jgi:glycosyltransferase 2 family protein
MKKKLFALLRILVSVGILAYLFNSIFEKEADERLDVIAESPTAKAADLARQLRVSTAQVELLRAQAIEQNPETQTDEVNLKRLTWRDRIPLAWELGPQALKEVFQKVSLWWFSAGVLAMGVVCLIGIIRWQMILRVQGLELKFPRASSIFFVGMFFNAFLLGSTGGDVIKAWYVAHETHHKKAEAVATVVVDRLIGLLALFVLTLVMMTIYWHRVFDDVRLRSFAVITLAFVLTCVAGTIIGLWKGFADKVPKVRQFLQRMPRYDMMKRMVEAYRQYALHPVILLNTMLLSFGVHIVSMLSIWFIGLGLGVRTTNGFIDYLLYLPIINSVTAIPISISGFGVRELMYAEMFGVVGVAGSTAVALSLLGYLASLFWSLVGAVFYLTHRKEVTAIEHEADEEK